ncbi:MAG: DUF1573 domain-containing protein [Bacteroidota bacterium]
MKKIILSIGIAAITLIAANAQESKTTDKPKEVTPVVKAPAVKSAVKLQPERKAVEAQPVKSAVTEQPEQPATTVPVVQNPNAPEIAFEKDVMDYGTVEYNGDGVREFKFTNTGKEPLIISRAKASCGCTVPSWPKEPILPGKTGVIKVKYSTNRVGSFTKTITITSNAKTPNKRLTIKGTIKSNPVQQNEQTVPEKKVTEGVTPIKKS